MVSKLYVAQVVTWHVSFSTDYRLEILQGMRHSAGEPQSA